MDKKYIAIIILSISTLVLGYLLFSKPDNIVSPDSIIIQARYDSIAKENQRVLADSKIHLDKLKIRDKQIDSLKNLEPKITIKYVYKYKDIDNAGNQSILNGFDSLFTINGYNK